MSNHPALFRESGPIGVAPGGRSIGFVRFIRLVHLGGDAADYSERLELATSAGAYWMSLKARIQSAGAGLDELAEADSPLPVAGLSLAWNLTPDIQLTVNGDYLSIDYEDFDGRIANYRAGLRYRILEYVGIGIGYDLLDVDVDSKSSSFSGFVKYRQQGPTAFLTLRF